MKGVRLWVFIFSFCLFLPSLDVNGEQELPLTAEPGAISMDFQDARLKDILKLFSIQSGLNFIASEAVQDRNITLYLDKVPLKESMDKLFKANNLSYELDKKANIFIVKDWGKPQIETITKVFYLKYATVSTSPLKSEVANQMGSTASTSGGQTTTSGGSGSAGGGGILEAVKKIISEYGSVIEDSRTNSLIVTDIPSRMPIISQIIASLDMPVPQVMLEVEMLDVSKNAVDTIGLKFKQGISLTLDPANRGTSFPFDSTRALSAARTITTGSLSFTDYQLTIDFLKTQSDTKYLARPRILTLDNETAEIRISTQEMIGTVSLTTTAEGTAVTSANAERTETGVVLRVTPQINLDTGEITMFIFPTVKDASASTLNTAYRDPEERSTKSIVRIKDGETVTIGGLIRNDSTQTVTKLPILGDIPILGSLFRHKNKDKDRERELLVFITPHIIKETNIELAQSKKVDLPEREQNIVSGIDRQQAISNTLNNFEKKKKR